MLVLQMGRAAGIALFFSPQGKDSQSFYPQRLLLSLNKTLLHGQK